MANEKRLIDANVLRQPIESKIYWGGVGLLEAIDEAPTVDAVEVVRGRWKYYHKQNKAVCTNCSFERDLDTNFGKAISCPNCGADMRERKDDGK